MVAHSHGQVLNLAELARSLGSSEPTARRYLDILCACGDRDAYFWGTHSGAELDLLLSHKGRRLGIEFKFSDRPATTKSMRVVLRDLALDAAITAIPLPRLLEIL